MNNAIREHKDQTASAISLVEAIQCVLETIDREVISPVEDSANRFPVLAR